jgi:outer membrane protein assembly factor BamE (lipoprotein component of BamABCDE complex)
MAGTVRVGAVLALGLLAASCSSIVGHKGYLADEVVLRSVQPGVDNRTSVERTLGQPSYKSQFGEPVWYYISSTTSQRPFTTPRISEHMVLAVRFDDAGNVISADRTGLEQVARIHPEDDATPTLGRERSFLQDLFGNIGQVGTGAGAAGGQQGGGGG